MTWSWKSDLTSKKKPCSEMGMITYVMILFLLQSYVRNVMITYVTS